MKRLVRIAVSGTAAVCVLAACTSNTTEPSSSITPSDPVPHSAEPATVTTGLAAPWSIAFHGQTPLISERDSARILELSGGEPREVGVIPGVSATGEAGLLGIAVRDDHLYVYSTADDENRIERYPLTGEPGSLALGDGKELLGGIPAAAHHDGGRIAFGPDGMLYVTTGDAGDTESSQDRESLAGKILRMTPDGQVPDENPFDDSYVYSYGHRNPQGIGWDETGRMYACEFGQNTWDELNVIEAGGNYGWPEVEGIAGDDEDSSFIDPVQQWPTDEASPSGMTIADGTIYIANLRGERLRAIPLSALGQSTETVTDQGRLRDVVRTPDGKLWILTNNTDGRGEPGPDDDRILELSPS